MAIQRFKGKTSVFDIIQADDGHLMLISDMEDILSGFVDMAVKSGADEEQLKLLVSAMGKDKH